MNKKFSELSSSNNGSSNNSEAQFKNNILKFSAVKKTTPLSQEILKELEFENCKVIKSELKTRNNGIHSIKEILLLLKSEPDNLELQNKLFSAYFINANHYRENNEFEKSIIYYNKALEYDKSNPDVYYNLGICFKKINNHPKAYYYFEKSLKYYQDESGLGKRKSSTYIELAVIKLQNGEEKAALEFYNKALVNFPNNYKVHFAIGEIYFKRKDFPLALMQYIKVVKLNPDLIQGYINIGQIYVLLNNLEKATEYYKRVLEIEPGNSTALGNLALINYKLGKKESSYKLLLKLSQKNEINSYLIPKYLGIMQLEKGKIDDAIENFMTAIDLNPRETDNYINLGVCFHKLGNSERAITEYFKAIEIDPENIIALKNLALICMDKDKYKEAIIIYEKILELEPENKTILKNLGNAFRKTGEIEKAIIYYKNHLEFNKNDSEALLNLAISYFESEQLIKAIKLLNNLIETNKSYLAICYGYLSKIYQKNGQLNRAQEYIRKCSQIDWYYAKSFIQQETIYNISFCDF